MRPVTKDEFNNPNIPHVTMTPEGYWNPQIFDDHVDWDELMNAIPPTSTTITDMLYKQNGDLNIPHSETDSHPRQNLGSECTTDLPKVSLSDILDSTLSLNKVDNKVNISKLNRSMSSLDKVDNKFSDNIDNNISSLQRKKTISWNKDLVDLDTYSANSRSMASSVFKDDNDINPTPCPFENKY